MIDPRAGLSTAEAHRRLIAFGRNELPQGRRRGPLQIFVEVIREPVLGLLLAATVIYLIFGQPKDAILLVGAVGVIVAIELYQGGAAERALAALRAMSAGDASVLRDGRLLRVPLAEVVPGDLVLVTEGERVPADATILTATDLLVDESLLTGESVPVHKSLASGTEAWASPGGDDLPFLYAQTVVVRGRAYALVRATGPRTEVSRIAHLLDAIDVEVPTLHRQTRALVFTIAAVAVVLCIAVAGLIGWHTGDWFTGLLAGVALAISLLPEEIPVVLTVFTTFGARRLAAKNVLTRRLGAIPTLGALTVLCVDKTGTLTVNRMTVSEARIDQGGTMRASSPGFLEPYVRPLLRAAVRASDPEAVDPMERAILEVAHVAGIPPPPREDRDLVHRYPLRPERASLIMVRREDGAASGRVRAYVKGAPEGVIPQCAGEVERRERWLAAAAEMATRGLRVLAVGETEVAASGVPESPDGIVFQFVGLLGFSDPLRPGVPAAIAECRDAGVRVVMLTGDHPETARSIAREAGLAAPDRVVVGSELGHLTETSKARLVRSVNVFARISPTDKLAIVEALKRDGEVVGVTGDGVNDAPALRAANVGVAMGQRGTEVAREAASLVLLDDAFPTLVVALRTGRRIYDNIRKAINYLLAIHVAIAGMALLPVLFGFPLLLYPVEIVFLEFIVDPSSTLAFEAEEEESDVMTRPPRDPRAPVADRSMILMSLVQGGGVLAATSVLYFALLDDGMGAAESRTLAFACLLVANLTLVLATRSLDLPVWRSIRRPNRILLWVGLAGIGLLVSALYLPPLPEIFGFVPPDPIQLLGAVALGALAASVMEPFKRWIGRLEVTAPPRRTDLPHRDPWE
ncbi:MAG: cation-translocating P-type ATPase [Thermoplasmata archaeon]